MTKSIGVLTAGGDSPGLNAALRGIGKAAEGLYGMQVIGFRDGFRGLMENRTIWLDGRTLSGVLTLVGIFAMRWNVVVGGQLFSKSFLGYTTYKMDFATREGLLPAILLMILPFGILAVLVKLLPPWHAPETETTPG